MFHSLQQWQHDTSALVKMRGDSEESAHLDAE